MEEEGTAAVKAETAPHEDDPRKPDSPPELHSSSWKYTATRALREFSTDQCTDLAAALTYYAVLAVFPALLALVSLLGVFGQGEQTVTTLLQLIKDLGASGVTEVIQDPIRSMVKTPTAGVALVIGVLGALWSASGYVGAFGRALNRIYEVDEGRPFWKLRPQQLLITTVVVLLVGAVLTALVVSGPVVEVIGNALGIGPTAQTVWSIAKWPLILVVVIAIVALLYYATPNIKQPKFRWISIGAAIAILVWIVVSVLFGLYVANFGSYNKTYGSLAGVIVFLLWVWLTNLALLFGAEVDAELERARQLQGGIEAEETLQLPPRDTAASEKAAEKKAAVVAQGRAIREASPESGAESGSAGDAPSRDRTGERMPAGRHTPGGASPDRKGSDEQTPGVVKAISLAGVAGVLVSALAKGLRRGRG